MPAFYAYIRLCLKMAGRHFQKWIDLPLYAVSFGLPFLAWKYPDFWNTAWGQSTMNGLWWQIPTACSSSILIFRFLLSPYWVYREALARAAEEKKSLVEENNALVEHLKSQNLEIQAKLERYELVPITIEVGGTDGDSLINLLVTNRGNLEQRVLNMYLALSPWWEEQGVEHELLLRDKKRIGGFPYTMPPRSSFELTLSESVDSFLDFGTASFCAVLKLEDGRNAKSVIIDISKKQQREFPLPLSFEESVRRAERIGTFLEAYSILYKSIDPTKEIDLALLVTAGIDDLESNDEIQEACDRLVSRNMRHAIEPVYFSIGVDVHDFFRTMKNEDADLSGTSGSLELLYWKKDKKKEYEEFAKTFVLPASSEQEQLEQGNANLQTEPDNTLLTHETKDNTQRQEKSGEENCQAPKKEA